MSESMLQAFRSLDPEEAAGHRQDVRVLVLTGLGLNCESETAAAA